MHLFKWLKFKTQHHKLVRIWSCGNSDSLLVQMQNGAATLKIASYKIVHTLMIQQSHSLYFQPKRVGKISTEKPAHYVYSNFIDNCQNLESINMSFSMRMDK